MSHKMIDEEACERCIKHGTRQQLSELRATLVQRKKLIEAQLGEDTAAFREARAELIRQGLHPREADLRAGAESDIDWRARANALQRRIDGWIGRLNVRIHELHTPSRLGAVSIAGAGRGSVHATAALNNLLERGCKVMAFAVVGDDLVVIATEPAP